MISWIATATCKVFFVADICNNSEDIFLVVLITTHVIRVRLVAFDAIHRARTELEVVDFFLTARPGFVRQVYISKAVGTSGNDRSICRETSADYGSAEMDS